MTGCDAAPEAAQLATTASALTAGEGEGFQPEPIVAAPSGPVDLAVRFVEMTGPEQPDGRWLRWEHVSAIGPKAPYAASTRYLLTDELAEPETGDPVVFHAYVLNRSCRPVHDVDVVWEVNLGTEDAPAWTTVREDQVATILPTDPDCDGDQDEHLQTWYHRGCNPAGAGTLAHPEDGLCAVLAPHGQVELTLDWEYTRCSTGPASECRPGGAGDATGKTADSMALETTAEAAAEPADVKSAPALWLSKEDPGKDEQDELVQRWPPRGPGGTMIRVRVDPKGAIEPLWAPVEEKADSGGLTKPGTGPAVHEQHVYPVIRGNNTLVTYTNAITVAFFVERGEYEYRNRLSYLAYEASLGDPDVRNPRLGGWDDWAQFQLGRTTLMRRFHGPFDLYEDFDGAQGGAVTGEEQWYWDNGVMIDPTWLVNPANEDWMLDRLRLDEIVITEDRALRLDAAGRHANAYIGDWPDPNDRTIDLVWGWETVPNDECASDADCKPQHQCTDTYCVKRECTTDADCPDRFQCVRELEPGVGRCVWSYDEHHWWEWEQTLFHEVGHARGLGHPGDANPQIWPSGHDYAPCNDTGTCVCHDSTAANPHLGVYTPYFMVTDEAGAPLIEDGTCGADRTRFVAPSVLDANYDGCSNWSLTYLSPFAARHDGAMHWLQGAGYHDGHSNYEAAVWNRYAYVKNARGCNMNGMCYSTWPTGAYREDVPEHRVLRILDADGQPWPGATVKVYMPARLAHQPDVAGACFPVEEPADLDNRIVYDDTVDEAGVTDEAGELEITSLEGEAQGHKGIFLQVVLPGPEGQPIEDYFWLDRTTWNFAFWAGQEEVAVLELQVEAKPAPPLSVKPGALSPVAAAF